MVLNYPDISGIIKALRAADRQYLTVMTDNAVTSAEKRS